MTWPGESRRHAMAARGIPSGRRTIVARGEIDDDDPVGRWEHWVNTVPLRKLEKPLYHGTACSNVDSIWSLGLRSVEESVHRETDNPFDKTEERAFEYGVYVTEDPEDVWFYAYDASKEVPAWMLERVEGDIENMCVIVIDKLPVTDVMGNEYKVGSDGYGDLMTNDDIPPRCIKEILYYTDLPMDKRPLGF